MRFWVILKVFLVILTLKFSITTHKNTPFFNETLISETNIFLPVVYAWD